LLDRIIDHKKSIKGTIEIPGDKSISHRAVILGSIAQGTSTISGLARSSDVQSTIQAMLKAGISIYEKNRKMVIDGKGITGFENRKKATPIDIDCGNSGTTARLLIGLFSGAGFPARFIGDASLMKRPMDRVVDPISKIGVQIISNKGYLPVEIQGGTPAPFEYTVPVASAQVKTACLLAALFIRSSSIVTEISETRDHTERMLVLMDADIKTRNTLQGKSIIISGRRELTPLDIAIPGDISSAVFFIAAALVSPSSEILLKNVLLNPTRAHMDGGRWGGNSPLD
jgi:3-phosphoshikimate 1-carboxyvinyltransferase